MTTALIPPKPKELTYCNEILAKFEIKLPRFLYVGWSLHMRDEAQVLANELPQWETV